MTLIAGLDVGNTTTEIVVAEAVADRMKPVEAARRPTVGTKGSRESLLAATRLLEDLEEKLGRRCSAIALAELHAVRTAAVELPTGPAANSPLRRVDRASVGTPGGCGFAVGVHVPFVRLSDPPTAREVVVSIPEEIDFEDGAAGLRRAMSGGWRIVGVLAEGDDAVLISNRLRVPPPVADEVPVGDLGEGETVALEVAGNGRTVTRLADPIALAVAFGLEPGFRTGLADFARGLADSRVVVLAHARPDAEEADSSTGGWYEVGFDGGVLRRPLKNLLTPEGRKLRPGSVRRVTWPAEDRYTDDGGATDDRVRDLYAVDLDALEDASWLRRGVVEGRSVPLAALGEGDPAEPEATLASVSERPVFVVGTEATAAAFGAGTTPGAPPGAAVCDLGGGTIDFICGGEVATVAGAGELVTTSVSALLGIPRSAAEWAKRGPSMRIDSPHLAHQEDGSRTFLHGPVPGSQIGKLVVRTANGLLDFHDRLSPEEWRSLRLAVKQEVIGGNVERCIEVLGARPTAMLVAGGAALDEEVIRIVFERLRHREIVVGKANVVGRYGPRYAAAFGLVLAFARDHFRRWKRA